MQSQQQGSDRPAIEERPWGFFEILASGPDHRVKRITVLPGARLSLQKHERREEHWFFVSGSGLMTLGDDDFPVDPGEALDIPRGDAHRIRATSDVPLVIIEVQTGDYFGEDDILRLEDDYGRIAL